MVDLLFSSDAHFFEPADLWTSRLPRSLHARAPKRERSGDTVTFGADGYTYFRMENPDGKLRVRGMNPINAADPLRWTAEEFMAACAADGLWGTQVFPNDALVLHTLPDPEFKRTCFRVYNDAMHELFEPYRDRVVPTAMIAVDDDVAHAVEEIERCADLGYRGVTIPVTPRHRYGLRRYDPIWAVCERRSLPVTFHVGAGYMGLGAVEGGHEVAAPEDDEPDFMVHTWDEFEANTMNAELMASAQVDPLRIVGETQLGAALVTELVYTGVLERYPRLQVVPAELGAGWLGPLLDIMEDRWEIAVNGPRSARATAGGRSLTYTPLVDTLSVAPADYVRRQVHVTFQGNERTALRALDITGVEPLMWGSDMPHPDGTYPYSRQFVERMMSDSPIGADARAAILGGNLARLYGIDLPAAA